MGERERCKYLNRGSGTGNQFGTSNTTLLLPSHTLLTFPLDATILAHPERVLLSSANLVFLRLMMCSLLVRAQLAIFSMLHFTGIGLMLKLLEMRSRVLGGSFGRGRHRD